MPSSIEQELAEIELGEDSTRQFKATLAHPDQIAAEIVAFLNTQGGTLYIGVSDSGQILGLTAEELARTSALLANVASQNVRPPCTLQTFNLRLHDKKFIKVVIPERLKKPYCDNEGRFWLKNGPNKCKVTSPGTLPNNLTIESIRLGVSIARNSLLLSYIQHILPYSGLGSGIPRSLRAYPHIQFDNNPIKTTFTATIQRII